MSFLKRYMGPAILCVAKSVITNSRLEKTADTTITVTTSCGRIKSDVGFTNTRVFSIATVVEFLDR